MGAPTVVSVDQANLRWRPGRAGSRSTFPATCRAVRDRLHAAGIETFEADVRFAVRYLIERGIKAGCAIEGEATAQARP